MPGKQAAAAAHNARYNYGMDKLRPFKALHDRGCHIMTDIIFLSWIVASGCNPTRLIIRSGVTPDF